MPPIDLVARIEAATQIATAPEGDAPAGQGAPQGQSIPQFADEVEVDGGDGGVDMQQQAAAQAAQEQLLAAKRALIEEKLAAQRERRQAAGLSTKAKEAAARAAAAAAAAEAERSKWESLRQGNFLEGVRAMGRDPREVFAEMQREAIEASTPEAELKRMRADFEKQLGEKLQPLQETIEQLRTEREQLEARQREHAARVYEQTLVSAYRESINDPAYMDLRAEYGDEGLFGYVDHFDKNPQQFLQAAHHYGVRLTDPSKGFTMPEILTVLKAAQEAHDKGKQERRSKFMPASPPDQTQSGKPHTVNGTAASPNAGTPIGNDLAAERAAPSRKLSRRERIQAEIDRIERR